MTSCSTSCTRHPASTSILLLLALLVTIAVTGCSGSTSPASPPTSVQPAPVSTATTLTATPSTVVVGGAVALTATVKLSSGSPASGSVSFNDGITSLGAATLDSTGTAALSLTTLAAGTHSITASFAGSSTQAASGSAPVTVTVTAAPKLATFSSINVLNGVLIGEPLEIGAFVAPSTGIGTGIPTGTIAFFDGARSIASANLDLTGRAVTTVTTLSLGKHLITLAYNGDATYAASDTSIVPISVDIGGPATPSYTNPLTLNLPTGGTVPSCADPATIKVQASGVNTWYLYCTSDALYPGDPATHYINIFESRDLVTWTYDGNAFTGPPTWAPKGPLWAPAIKFFNGEYHLYYASPPTNQDAAGGAAIGVGVSLSPKGPFIDYGSPVVEPEPTSGDCCGGRDRSTIDPDVIQDSTGQRYISFGSFDGGIFLRKLSADGLTSDKSSEIQIAATNRYEGGSLWQHGQYWYLFASSANCCNGPLTGYSVFVGRAPSPTGPFIDKRGVSMAAVNAGGEEFLFQNGNRWLGPGGNVLFTDEAGQDYILYHAVASDAPVYAGTTSYTARPALLDTIAWDSNGWPIVNQGYGPSAAPRAAPFAQPDAAAAPPLSGNVSIDTPGDLIPSLSDDFTTSTLAPQWSTLHAAPAYTFANGALNLPTVSLDSCCNMNQLPMLVENAPNTDYVLETHMTINLPVTGSGLNYAQGDLFIYGDDQTFSASTSSHPPVPARSSSSSRPRPTPPTPHPVAPAISPSPPSTAASSPSTSASSSAPSMAKPPTPPTRSRVMHRAAGTAAQPGRQTLRTKKSALREPISPATTSPWTMSTSPPCTNQPSPEETSRT